MNEYFEYFLLFSIKEILCTIALKYILIFKYNIFVIDESCSMDFKYSKV